MIIYSAALTRELENVRYMPIHYFLYWPDIHELKHVSGHVKLGTLILCSINAYQEYRKNISISNRWFWEEQLFELYTHSFSQYLFSFSSILNKHLFVCELEGKLGKWNMVNFTRCVIYKVCALRVVSRKT